MLLVNTIPKSWIMWFKQVNINSISDAQISQISSKSAIKLQTEINKINSSDKEILKIYLNLSQEKMVFKHFLIFSANLTATFISEIFFQNLKYKI